MPTRIKPPKGRPFSIVLYILVSLPILSPTLNPTFAQPQPLTQAAGPHWDFFAFDNGVGRDTDWSPTQQAKLLSQLGYDGIGYTGTQQIDQRLAEMRSHGLNIYSLYIGCYLKREHPFDPAVYEILPKLQGSTVQLWIHFPQRGTDEAAVAALQQLAEKAGKYGVSIVIYPHHAFHVETAEHALKIVKAVDRDNVGVTLNLCHELRAGNGDRLPQILDKVADKLQLVSINGAYVKNSPEQLRSWSRLIRPLDEGDFTLTNFLKKLKSIDYHGPIGLQCYAIPSQPEDHLQRSIQVWRNQPL